MAKVSVKAVDVVDRTRLPLLELDQLPGDGDPLEVDGEMYYVCDSNYGRDEETPVIGVIPLVVKNPANVKNIQNYINCLSVAHRRVQFMKEGKECIQGECDTMIIS